MKTCKKSNSCCYGNCFKKNTCAYRNDMKDSDPCPLYAENWEEIIDRLVDKRVIIEDVLYGC